MAYELLFDFHCKAECQADLYRYFFPRLQVYCSEVLVNQRQPLHSRSVSKIWVRFRLEYQFAHSMGALTRKSHDDAPGSFADPLPKTDGLRFISTPRIQYDHIAKYSLQQICQRRDESRYNCFLTFVFNSQSAYVFRLPPTARVVKTECFAPCVWVYPLYCHACLASTDAGLFVCLRASVRLRL